MLEIIIILNYLATDEVFDPDAPISKYKVMPSKFVEIFKSFDTQNKYTVDDFTFRTDDGYDLVCFRINLKEIYKKNIVNKKNVNKPMQAFHGFTASALSFFGNKNSFFFNLQDKGIDLWCINFRGNIFNYSHRNPEITSEKFFDFTIHDVALKDVPTIYKNVLEITGKDKQTFLSNSMASVIMLIALSDNSTAEYINKHTERAICYAFIAFFNLTKDPIAINEISGRLLDEMLEVSKEMRVFHTHTGNLLSDTKRGAAWLKILTEKYIVLDFGKSDMVKVDGVKDNIMEQYALREMSFYYLPFLRFFGHRGYLLSGYGISIKLWHSLFQIIRFQQQNGKNQDIFKYDHGKEINRELYGVEEVPVYDQRNVKIQMDAIVGSKDLGGNYDAATSFKNHIKKQNNNTNIQVHQIEQFHHQSFLFPRYKKDIDELINKLID